MHDSVWGLECQCLTNVCECKSLCCCGHPQNVCKDNYCHPRYTWIYTCTERWLRHFWLWQVYRKITEALWVYWVVLLWQWRLLSHCGFTEFRWYGNEVIELFLAHLLILVMMYYLTCMYLLVNRLRSRCHSEGNKFFANHSIHPNCFVRLMGSTMYAKRNIEPGKGVLLWL